MNEWKECKLENLGYLKRGRSRHRPRYAFHLYGGQYPFIQTGQIREAQKYITCYEQTYNEEGLKQSKLWPKGTLCITIAANIAELGILSFDACFPDSVLGFIPDKNKVTLDFIYYTLIFFQKRLKHIGEGSVQDNINLGTFQNILFPIPPLPQQRAIATVLSSLDDKIDLLHRQNKTLEAMAETLFRQWFVEGRKEEWETINLSKLAQFKNGKSRPTTKGKIPIYGGNGILGFSDKSNTDGEVIIIGRVGAYCGSVYFETQKIWVSDNAILVKGTHEKYMYFLLYFLKMQNLNYLAVGSSQPLLTQTLLSKLLAFSPPNKLLQKFNTQVQIFIYKQKNNKQQIRTLTHLRDTLLPKLMSGKIRVRL